MQIKCRCHSIGTKNEIEHSEVNLSTFEMLTSGLRCSHLVWHLAFLKKFIRRIPDDIYMTFLHILTSGLSHLNKFVICQKNSGILSAAPSRCHSSWHSRYDISSEIISNITYTCWINFIGTSSGLHLSIQDIICQFRWNDIWTDV